MNARYLKELVLLLKGRLLIVITNGVDKVTCLAVGFLILEWLSILRRSNQGKLFTLQIIKLKPHVAFSSSDASG